MRVSYALLAVTPPAQTRSSPRQVRQARATAARTNPMDAGLLRRTSEAIQGFLGGVSDGPWRWRWRWQREAKTHGATPQALTSRTEREMGTGGMDEADMTTQWPISARHCVCGTLSRWRH